MRLPKLRFSLRLLMVCVALSALTAGGWVLRRRADEYRKAAARYARQENSAMSMKELNLEWGRQEEEELNELRKKHHELIARLKSKGIKIIKSDDFLTEGLMASERRVASNQEEVELYATDAAHYGALRRKYERAARYPWLPLAPDPPPPRPMDRAAYWRKRGEYGRALAVYEEAIRLRPDSKQTKSLYNNSAWILATCPDARYRNGRRAVESATQACERDGCVSTSYLNTLAAAYAEVGEFETAVRWQKDALGRVATNSPAWQEFKDRLTLYQQGKPYREERNVE